MRVTPFVVLSCTGLALGAGPRAYAQGLGLRVVSETSRLADSQTPFDSDRAGITPPVTLTEPALDGVRIDFGDMSNRGAPPRTGRRVEVKGGAYYVATLEIEVVPLDPVFPHVRAHLRHVPDVLGPAGKSRVLRSATFPQRVNVYAQLVQDGVTRGGAVVLAVNGTEDWATGRGFVDLGPSPTPVAWGLGAGDRLRCEIGFFASDHTQGPQLARVRLEAR